VVAPYETFWLDDSWFASLVDAVIYHAEIWAYYDRAYADDMYGNSVWAYSVMATLEGLCGES
jgi:hypothetical protein